MRSSVEVLYDIQQLSQDVKAGPNPLQWRAGPARPGGACSADLEYGPPAQFT